MRQTKCAASSGGPGGSPPASVLWDRASGTTKHCSPLAGGGLAGRGGCGREDATESLRREVVVRRGGGRRVRGRSPPARRATARQPRGRRLVGLPPAPLEAVDGLGERLGDETRVGNALSVGAGTRPPLEIEGEPHRDRTAALAVRRRRRRTARQRRPARRPGGDEGGERARAARAGPPHAAAPPRRWSTSRS